MTSGRRAFWLAFAIVAAGVAAVTAVNVLNALHEARQQGLTLDPARALLLEASSTSVILALVPLIWRAGRLWPPRWRGWSRLLAIHLLCATLFSMAHVLGMQALRHLLLAGGSPWSLTDLDALFYEYRKDLLTYVVMLGSGEGLRLWFEPRRAAPAPPDPARAEPAAPATIDIRDGARTLRTPVAEIAAVTSAGNYVEVKLVDGRNPLTRATLAAMEQQLAPHGFLRTHRSWLVNPARVRVIAPAGSGDHRLELEGGLEAPLSRRYAEALERLREPI